MKSILIVSRPTNKLLDFMIRAHTVLGAVVAPPKLLKGEPNLLDLTNQTACRILLPDPGGSKGNGATFPVAFEAAEASVEVDGALSEIRTERLNVLYLTDPNGLLSDKFAFREPGNRPWTNFARCSAEDWIKKFDLGDVIVSNTFKQFCSRLWRRVDDRAPEAITLMPPAKWPSSPVVVGWMNPIVMQLDLSGENVALDTNGGATSEGDPKRLTLTNLLFHLLSPEALMYVEPLWEEADATRVLFLQELENLAQSLPTMTRVQRLLVGNTETPSCSGFLFLDALAGQFILRPRATVVQEPTPETNLPNSAEIWEWRPPQKLSLNAEWAARYWCERMGFRFVKRAKGDDQTSVLALPKARPSRERGELEVVTLSEEEELNRSCAKCLRFFRECKADPLARVVAKVLDNCSDLNARAHQPPLERASGGPGSPYQVRFSWANFFRDFAADHLRPHSRLLVFLPDLPFETNPTRQWMSGTAVDLVQKPLRGDLHFWEQVWRAWERRAAQQDPIEYRWDWWSDWLTAIFQADASVDLRFVASSPRGFILSQNLLAVDPLGKGEPAYFTPAPEVIGFDV